MTHSGAEEERSCSRQTPAPGLGFSSEPPGADQRQRLISAATAVLGERGLAATRVRHINRRAGATRTDFYAHFDGLEDCVATTFSELFERLLAAIEEACAAESDCGARAAAGLRRALRLLAADPATARVLTLEVLGLGERGARLQEQAITLLASRLRVLDDGLPSAGPSEGLDWWLLSLATALIRRRLLAGEVASLPTLGPELLDFAQAGAAESQ